MSSKPVRVGVIGTGCIGRVHLEKLQSAGAQIVAVCDIVPERVEQAAAKFKVERTFTDYRKLLRLDGLEAVTVGLPNYLHAPVTLAALQTGKHVLCEKPMAMNVAECKRMIAAAASAKKVLQIGLVSRFGGEGALARRFVAEGRIGKPYHAAVQAMRRRGVPGRGGWFTTRTKSGGGPLLDIGVHLMDLTCWIMGHPRPVAVSAHAHQKFIQRDDYTYVGMWSDPVPGGTTDVEDYVVAMIRFEGGATATLETCWAADITDEPWQTQVLGDRGGLLVRPHKELTIAGQDGSLLTDTRPLYRKTDAFVEEMKAFMAAVRGGKCQVPGSHGQYVQAILNAVYASARTGREVRISRSDLPAKM